MRSVPCHRCHCEACRRGSRCDRQTQGSLRQVWSRPQSAATWKCCLWFWGCCSPGRKRASQRHRRALGPARLCFPTCSCSHRQTDKHHSRCRLVRTPFLAHPPRVRRPKRRLHSGSLFSRARAPLALPSRARSPNARRQRHRRWHRRCLLPWQLNKVCALKQMRGEASPHVWVCVPSFNPPQGLQRQLCRSHWRSGRLLTSPELWV